MSSKQESIGRTLGVTIALCFVCAVIVATAAVSLRPLQQANVVDDMNRNILQAAGIYDESRTVREQFEASVIPKVIDLRTGKYVDIDPLTFNQRAAAKDASSSEALDVDPAGIKRQEHYSLVYLVEKDGALDKVILPIRGYGLWSTLYGFVALENDLNTIAGLGFYEHGETPGLGGEVDNPRWKAKWPGKQVTNNGELAIQVLKGSAEPGPKQQYQVDGLSGATLTTAGVNNFVRFWLGERGFAPYLKNLKNSEA